MKRFTDAVRSSVASENWYAALTLALLLPDICGGLETPQGRSGPRYKRWFREWVEPKFTVRLAASGKVRVFLSAEDCYALSCLIRYYGSDDTTNRSARRALYSIEFTTVPGTHLNQCNDQLQLHVGAFCCEMSDSVEAWDLAMQSDAGIQRAKETLVEIKLGSFDMGGGGYTERLSRAA